MRRRSERADRLDDLAVLGETAGGFLGEDRLPVDADLELVRVLQFITARFHLMNMGEQISIAAINRERELKSTMAAPRAESILDAVSAARAAGISGADFARALEKVEVGPTLTAHPTEARRRTVITKQLEITALVSPCHRANASAHSGRTQVCVTMLTLAAASLI